MANFAPLSSVTISGVLTTNYLVGARAMSLGSHEYNNVHVCGKSFRGLGPKLEQPNDACPYGRFDNWCTVHAEPPLDTRNIWQRRCEGRIAACVDDQMASRQLKL